MYRRLVQKSVAVGLVLTATVMPAAAKVIALKGQVGYIGEWAFSATMNAAGSASSSATLGSGATLYSGVLTMRHIGLCSVAGPEVHTGLMTASVSWDAIDKLTLSYDDERCVYDGPAAKDKPTRGFMLCKGGAQVPIYFKIAPDAPSAR